MANKELKQKFPIGKLYQINFGYASNFFEAYVNDNYRAFKCNEEFFLLLDINECDDCIGYVKITALLSTGERSEIFLFDEHNLKLIQ
jgi:hypothetical protein